MRLRRVANWFNKYRFWWPIGIGVTLAVAFHMWGRVSLGWMMLAFLVVWPAVGLVITIDGDPPIWLHREFWGELLFRTSLSGIGFAIDDGLVTYSAATYLALAAVGSAIALVAIRSGRVARGMREEHPFDGMPLEDGEILLLKKWNPTFHRLFDFALAMSDRALYVRRSRFLMPAVWERLEVPSICGVTLRAVSFRLWVLVAPTIALAALVIAPYIWLMMSVPVSRFPFLLTLLPLLVVFFIWAGFESVKTKKGRTELVIRQTDRTVSFRTPEDTSSGEKAFDRKMLREVLSVLEQHGVPVTDECLPPDIPQQAGPAAIGMETDSDGRSGLAFAAAVVACWAYWSAVSDALRAFSQEKLNPVLGIVLVLLPFVCSGVFHFMVVRNSNLSMLQKVVQVIGAAFFAPLLGSLVYLFVTHWKP